MKTCEVCKPCPIDDDNDEPRSDEGDGTRRPTNCEMGKFQ